MNALQRKLLLDGGDDAPEGGKEPERAPPFRPILAATAWPTNAHMIEDCARLGYLRGDWNVMDATFGKGVWWKLWRPERLTEHDIALDGVDFRALPEGDGTYDAVAFDPPYVSKGGRSTTTIPDFFERYGLKDAPRTPADLQRYIDAGTSECARVLKPGGVLLVKCKDYISSGKLWLGASRTLAHAVGLGLEAIDRLEHVGRPGPQPPGRRQVHARRNLSTLFVLRKGR